MKNHEFTELNELIILHSKFDKFGEFVVKNLYYEKERNHQVWHTATDRHTHGDRNIAGRDILHVDALNGT